MISSAFYNCAKTTVLLTAVWEIMLLIYKFRAWMENWVFDSNLFINIWTFLLKVSCCMHYESAHYRNYKM